MSQTLAPSSCFVFEETFADTVTLSLEVTLLMICNDRVTAETEQVTYSTSVHCPLHKIEMYSQCMCLADILNHVCISGQQDLGDKSVE